MDICAFLVLAYKRAGLPDLAAVTYVEPFVSSTSTGSMVRPQFTPQQRSFLVTEYARTQSVTEVLKH